MLNGRTPVREKGRSMSKRVCADDAAGWRECRACRCTAAVRSAGTRGWDARSGRGRPWWAPGRSDAAWSGAPPVGVHLLRRSPGRGQELSRGFQGELDLLDRGASRKGRGQRLGRWRLRAIDRIGDRRRGRFTAEQAGHVLGQALLVRERARLGQPGERAKNRGRRHARAGPCHQQQPERPGGQRSLAGAARHRQEIWLLRSLYVWMAIAPKAWRPRVDRASPRAPTQSPTRAVTPAINGRFSRPVGCRGPIRGRPLVRRRCHGQPGSVCGAAFFSSPTHDGT